MPNIITITATKANTTKTIEYLHPTTGVWQDSNILTGVPAGTYNDITVRLKNSNPAITAHFTGGVTVTGPTTSGTQMYLAGDSQYNGGFGYLLGVAYPAYVITQDTVSGRTADDLLNNNGGLRAKLQAAYDPTKTTHIFMCYIGTNDLALTKLSYSALKVILKEICTIAREEGYIVVMGSYTPIASTGTGDATAIAAVDVQRLIANDDIRSLGTNQATGIGADIVLDYGAIPTMSTLADADNTDNFIDKLHWAGDETTGGKALIRDKQDLGFDAIDSGTYPTLISDYVTPSTDFFDEAHSIGVNIDGNNVNRTVPTADGGYNLSGAVSLQALAPTGVNLRGHVSWKLKQAKRAYVGGFARANPRSYGQGQIDYGIYSDADSFTLYIYEKGGTFLSGPTYNDDDIASVWIYEDKIEYKLNGTVFYTNTTPGVTTAPHYAQFTFTRIIGAVDEVELVGNNIVPSGL